MESKVGAYSFIIGVILAVVIGLFSSMIGASTTGILTSILIVLGLIIGFLNIGGTDVKTWLMTATILVVVTYIGGASANLASISLVGTYLSGIFTAIMTLVIPATVIVALKEVWSLAQA